MLFSPAQIDCGQCSLGPGLCGGLTGCVQIASVWGDRHAHGSDTHGYVADQVGVPEATSLRLPQIEHSQLVAVFETDEDVLAIG